MKTKKCEKCNREITTNNFKKHINSCGTKIVNLHINEEWKQFNGLYKCPYCKEEYLRRGIVTHIMRKHIFPEKWVSSTWKYRKNENRKAWNKGLTKQTDERVKRSGETHLNNVKNGITIPGFKGKRLSKEAKEKLSIYQSQNNKGGRSKWYEVEKLNGEKVKVQGTWELAFVQVLNILDENWIKPGVGNKEHTFEWINKNGDIHHYTPDFYSPKLKKYFEVKGYWWGEDKLKMEYVLSQYYNLNLEIIQKKELEIYLKLIK